MCLSIAFKYASFEGFDDSHLISSSAVILSIPELNVSFDELFSVGKENALATITEGTGVVVFSPILVISVERYPERHKFSMR